MATTMDLLQAAFQHALAWTGGALSLSLGYFALIAHRLPTGDTLFFMSALLNIAALIGAGIGMMRVWHLAGAKSHVTKRNIGMPKAHTTIRVRRVVVRRPAPAYVLR